MGAVALALAGVAAGSLVLVSVLAPSDVPLVPGSNGRIHPLVPAAGAPQTLLLPSLGGGEEDSTPSAPIGAGLSETATLVAGGESGPIVVVGGESDATLPAEQPAIEPTPTVRDTERARAEAERAVAGARDDEGVEKKGARAASSKGRKTRCRAHKKSGPGGCGLHRHNNGHSDRGKRSAGHRTPPHAVTPAKPKPQAGRSAHPARSQGAGNSKGKSAKGKPAHAGNGHGKKAKHRR